MRVLRLLACVVLAATGLSTPRASAVPEIRHYGPFGSTSPDSGTCGNFWADDSFDREFMAQTSPSRDGTFSVVEQFKRGTFVTLAGASPGGCETNPGGTVEAGVTGKLHGTFVMTISGGVFNPFAVCTAASCGTTADFVATVYGPGASFEIPTFAFEYVAPHNGHWKNASADRGGNHGDITGAP